MTDSHPNIFSFTTDVPGTEVEVTVSVEPILRAFHRPHTSISPAN